MSAEMILLVIYMHVYAFETHLGMFLDDFLR